MAQLKDTTVNGILNVTNQVQEQGVRVYSPNNELSCVDIVPQIKTDTTEIRNDVNSLVTTVNNINTNVNNIKNLLERVHSLKFKGFLETCTWEQINAISKSGKASLLFSIGDTKTFTINDVEYTVRIVGFNHDQLSGGGYAGITFEMTSIYSSTHVMNSSSTSAGGWKDCEMREYLKSDLYNLINSDLRAVIKSVQKRTTSGSESTEIQITNDNIWLFSYIEVDPTTSGAGYEDEGTTYEYYKEHPSDSDRFKKRSGSSNNWWLRSPHTTTSSLFRYVTMYGSIYSESANMSRGVSFGFCV